MTGADGGEDDGAVAKPKPALETDEEADEVEDKEDTKVPAWVFGDGERPEWAGPGADELMGGDDDGLDDLLRPGAAAEVGEYAGKDGEDAAEGTDRRARHRRGDKKKKKKLSETAKATAELALEELRKSKAGGDYMDDPDEVLALGFEDVIAGNIATRFKYVPVNADDFGLSAEELLLLEDQDLNSYVGLRKLAPFRETPWVVPSRKRKRTVNELRKKLKQELKHTRLVVEEENVKGKGKENEASLADENVEARDVGEIQDPPEAKAAKKEKKHKRDRHEEASASEQDRAKKVRRKHGHKHGKQVDPQKQRLATYDI